MSKIIGIDLGTTNSCCAIWRNNNIEIIPDEFGNRTVPSVVAFTNMSRYIGLDAKNQTELNPTNVIYEVKRLIGKKIDDKSVKADAELLTYKIGGLEINDKDISSDEMSEVQPGAKKTELKRAFGKMSSGKRNSRPVLNKFVGMIA